MAGAGFVPLAAYGQDLTRSLWEQVGGVETLPKSCLPLFIGNLNSELKRGKLDKELVDAVVTHVLEWQMQQAHRHHAPGSDPRLGWEDVRQSGSFDRPLVPGGAKAMAGEQLVAERGRGVVNDVRHSVPCRNLPCESR